MKRLVAFLKEFRSGTGGTVAIESMLLLPILLWAYLAMFSFFDMMRQQSLNQKAAYTITDMLSRETQFINDTYITNAYQLFQTMVRANDNIALRISVLKWDEGDDRFRVDWSKSRGGKSVLTDGGVANWKDRLPVMLSDERIILVETWNRYDIPFKIGMEDFDMTTYVFTSPRFAPQLRFSNDG